MKLQYKHIKLISPLAFWIFQILIFFIRNIYKIPDTSLSALFKSIVYTYPLDIVTFLVFYFIFAPKFFRKQKLRTNVFFSVLYFIIYSFVWVYAYHLQGIPKEQLGVIYASSMGHNFLNAFYGIIIRIAIEWVESREKQKELEKQNVKTELALLRSQINPHFLFNTLNNINSFSQTSAEKTSYAIIKLSDIMRYMLYEAKSEKVLLSKEIKYIQDYLDLQRLRYENPEFVKFICGNIPANVFVAPMLFIPFIENAFKHGQKNGNEKIKIELNHIDKTLIFSCKNKKRKLNETEKSVYSGIGIENIRRRLDLIYPQKHLLNIDENQTDYSIHLKIELS